MRYINLRFTDLYVTI